MLEMKAFCFLGAASSSADLNADRNTQAAHGFSSRPDDLTASVDIYCDRFFQKNMHARVDCRRQLLWVLVVRRCDQNRIHILQGKKLIAGVGTEQLVRFFQFRITVHNQRFIEPCFSLGQAVLKRSAMAVTFVFVSSMNESPK